MRIWTLHPALLDRAALIACWRETLLAQKVLDGKTRGYTNHPQLLRFKQHATPLEAIGTYLSELANEAEARGYRFNRELILHPADPTQPLPKILCTDGQLHYEAEFLEHKIRGRAKDWLVTFSERLDTPQGVPAHPLFSIIPGPIEDWEKVKDF
ncbi:MAG: pyrimidine dimer DNA glycosylase/endonuclease V [Rothia sp. (in: high G+C Gram-positive bacteria)]|uniref:pyrimidine dimer DNA glycosylase/endonuclease V n=1 Tax=Rothia sp. (in: high G+C Gram-positive bacteria) TaxID=1885016 RepID=UPI0026E00BC6|nr:pyrimidine dimer DNA glycosylase/endonuclease V [Rothia sp. (in: high G+C Gram-positive bacteria)]MDO5749889.1 pyrimidine dimer DNA glycosylase/endonuclease V [Rothia sp. (in: high G+C Gram-positive bacteria)]